MKKKLSRTEKLIQEAVNFRGGSLGGKYLDSRLARELKRVHAELQILKEKSDE